MSMNRREFLTGITAGALLTACGKKSDTPLMNLRDVAERQGVQFVDTEGNPINLAGLQAKLDGNYSTMSFMYAGCGPVCPLTAVELTRLSQGHPNLKHIVISVEPAVDFPNKFLDQVLNSRGLRTQGPNANTIILYPSIDGTGNGTALSNFAAKDIENGFKLGTKGEKPEGHSGAVTLFDPQGIMLTRSTEHTEGIAKLADYLPQDSQISQGAKR